MRHHGVGPENSFQQLEAWMAAPWTEAVRLQRPLPDGTLRIVARGEKKDEAMLLGEAEA
jgi:putative SOS response-associated peptidase YedK